MFADDGCDKRMACLVTLIHLALSSGAMLPAFKFPPLKWREVDKRIHSSMILPGFDVLDLQAGSIS